MGILKNLLVTGAARFVNTIKGSITHAQNGMYYGTCSTAAATAAKVIELVDPTGFELKPGVMIAVKFTATNTASSVTLNVEGTGAKQVWYNNAVYTSTSSDVLGYANRVNYYVYDGTYWSWTGHGNDNNSWLYSIGYCTTAAATAAKVASCTNYTLTANTYLPFVIQYANTAASAITMNVNSKGAKPVYINGAASSSSNYTLPAGSYIAFYDGTNWYFRTDGKLPGDIEKVNGHTVAKDVPSNAVFTDTTALTSMTGTLGIGHGGTNATDAATARTNLGIGTVGTLSYGTSTSTFLRNDGTWATPPSGSGGSDGNNRRSFYGTCSTAAATKDKVVTLTNDDGWELLPGTIVGVKFTYTNTYSSATANPITLNVNSTGAKNIWYNTTHSGAGNTGTNTTIYGYANRYTFYMYDGTYWVWIHNDVVSNSNTVPAAQCETAAATAAKAASCTNFTLTANTYLHFNIRYANTSAGAITMNVNSQGAKPIYINGTASSSSNYTLPAGTYIAFYDGTNWYFNTDGTIPGNVLAGGDTGITTQAANTDTPSTIIAREIAAIANKPNGIYTNSISWSNHVNGYSICIHKNAYEDDNSDEARTVYYGYFIECGTDNTNCNAINFTSDGTFLNLEKELENKYIYAPEKLSYSGNDDSTFAAAVYAYAKANSNYGSIFTISRSGVQYLAIVQYASSTYGTVMLLNYGNIIVWALVNGTWTRYTLNKTQG